MKKSSRLLILLALAAIASISIPPKQAAASSCLRPACLIGPGCCVDAECASFCASRGGGVPHCDGGGTGGCCSCEIIE